MSAQPALNSPDRDLPRLLFEALAPKYGWSDRADHRCRAAQFASRFGGRDDPRGQPDRDIDEDLPPVASGYEPGLVRDLDDRPRSADSSASSRSSGIPAAPINPVPPPVISSPTCQAFVRFSSLRRRRSAAARLSFRRNPAGAVRFTLKVPISCVV
ncbi:hypothetical protein ETD86_35570 [Nonomuraea turkmeniaca]|uniref:Uncharacterized protein n=1 Tax=Nonomuraea turkmeniaca TaxID=103838 RepID=A0A5S4F5I0_9ACTN|nr:hypothetical protein [Nonomuraea turkmeniaca]TMR11509.1 hypothetical protein ETD86_35570 [Nonomuraea turkmeniaca]